LSPGRRLVCVGILAWDVAADVHAGRPRACESMASPIAAARLDLEVRSIWAQCPCDWHDNRQRSIFKRCVSERARVARIRDGLSPACFRLLVESAKRSTCGLLRKGAGTCCTYRPGSRAAECHVKLGSLGRSAGAFCRAAGGMLGQTPSCYDSCPPRGVRVCEPAETDAGIGPATAQAEEDIARSHGAAFDPDDPEQAALLLTLVGRLMPCYAVQPTLDFLPDAPLSGTAATSRGARDSTMPRSRVASPRQ
jgi:hypothetical protein